jgi:hypothetical protein
MMGIIDKRGARQPFFFGRKQKKIFHNFNTATHGESFNHVFKKKIGHSGHVTCLEWVQNAPKTPFGPYLDSPPSSANSRAFWTNARQVM